MKRSISRWKSLVGNGMLLFGSVVLISGLALGAAESAAFPKPFNTQVESIPLLTPQEAVGKFHLPPGFKATLFAGEPDVQQPIGFTTDARGRVWVAENYTYSESGVNFNLNLRDRIVILEDSDHDGRFDKRTVFWDGALKLTSVAVGFGGVFALCPPRLLFIPDRDGNDVPDSEPEVLLDGWEDGRIRHTLANGLKFGPDGWLYGRHGIQGTSLMGTPGLSREQRTPINVGVWKYHPVTHKIEVVAQGTTNPWGHDWDDFGQLFFINTVIGHLWHVVPGAYYQRMYGEPAASYLYELMDQTADHVHWLSSEKWSDVRKSTSGGTSDAGGGHAHSGLMFYLGDNWPQNYRNSMFTVNYHGKRLNSDVIERRGAGYVAHHGKDILQTDDPWFRGVDLLAGNDGGVFIADWSDIGECHDDDGIHRTSGRIYKITYGTPKAPEVADVRKLDSLELVRLQLHPNDWFVRQSRQVLQERAAAGQGMAAVNQALLNLFATQTDVTRKLRALWALHATGGTTPAWLKEQLAQPNEHLRVWAIQLLIEQSGLDPALQAQLATLARQDKSGLVLSFLTSALPKLALDQRWPLAEALASRADFASDPNLPLLIWYGIEPSIPQSRETAVRFAAMSSMGKLRQFTARRLMEDVETQPEAINALLRTMTDTTSEPFQTEILTGMVEAVQGRRQATPPAQWASLASRLAASPNESLRKRVQELAVVFGDGRAVDELRAIVSKSGGDLMARRRALAGLIQHRAENLLPLLQPLLSESDLAPDAIRALAFLGSAETPTLLLAGYNGFRPPARLEAINTLSSRPAFALALLEAVRTQKINKQEIGPFQVRQLRSLNQPNIEQALTQLWPEFRPISGEKQAQILRLKKLLTPDRLSNASAAEGRVLYTQLCATCHSLFGEGGKIGPEITGADRRNLDYLLENILDPSSTVPDAYRVSVVNLKDNRVLTGILLTRNERAITLQTLTEKLIIEHKEIETITQSTLSMMPDGLLETLSESDLLNLTAYLMSPQQVALKNVTQTEPKPAGARTK